MEIDKGKLLDLLKNRAKYVRNRRDVAEGVFCLIGYIITVVIAYKDIIRAAVWQKVVIAFVGCLYLLVLLHSVFTGKYSVETLFREICACNNSHSFTIAVVKDKNRFLLKYDKRWKSWLFPYTKADTDEPFLDFLRYEVGIKPVEIIKRTETDVTKESVSAGMIKTYHHKFCQIAFDGRTDKNQYAFAGTKYRWFTIDQMKQNKRIMDTNSETVSYVAAEFL
ncbi:MAG: hypothetical protein J6P28_03675 [Treponema sp.]|nr:hypothetical protein [Treponema sp.]